MCALSQKEASMPRKKIFFWTTALIIATAVLMTGPAGAQAPLKILVSNDDGADAPGIAALADALSRVGTVTVAAPSKNWSAVSHGMTFSGPIMVQKTTKKGIIWYAIDALPATCVRLGLEALLPEKPDIVVSGINRGENTGLVAFYSATVACAREAAFQGIPSIAFSLESSPAMDYAAAANFIVSLVREVKKRGLRRGTYLNVNLPALPKERIKGVMVTRLDERPSLESYERRTNPEGQVTFWPLYKELGAGDTKADIWALRNGYISVTPMSIDQTDEQGLKDLADMNDF
jgi:5'-nucleotidase